MIVSSLGARRLLAVGGGALALIGCTPEREQPPAPEPAPAPTPAGSAPMNTAPVVTPPLGRADLIEGARAATDSLIGGTAYPERVVAFAGRQFRLRLPFGCNGPSPADAGLGYTVDAQAATLRLTARPQVWTQTPWAAPLAAPGAEPPEAVEGFWIRRPWLTAEGCPVQPTPEPDLPPTPETLGLAQVFGPDSSRLLRRGDRPYETTRPLPADAPPPADGFRLVLEGRVAAGLRQPVRCRAEGADRRPVCLVLVEFTRVAFEAPDGARLEEWTN